VHITDEQWKVVEQLPCDKDRGERGAKGGRPRREARDILDAVLWVLRTGAPWADLPGRFPPYQTCHRRFQQWSCDRTL
jgi:transposase